MQIATCFEKQGPDCFTRIEQELSEFMQAKGYRELADAKGKLKLL